MQNKKAKQYFKGDSMAADAWQGKYAVETEETPDDMHKRLAKEFATVSSLDEKEIYNLFKDFKYVVPQGSIMSMLGHPDKIGSLSNCFVVGQPYDSYGGIFQKDQQLAQLMKRRGGVGIDISTLRPGTTKVSNSAGTSTGAISFMERYSNTTREVAQNGRRGALMITIDIRHPDSLDFINIKQDRTKVTGANISVMLHNDFMEAVKNDEDYILRFPCDLDITDKHSAGEYNELVKEEGVGYLKKVKAKEYYDAIVHNAWDNAEPGQIFIDKHWNYSPDTPYAKYKGVTTNPCGEIFMGPYDACRLLALNLFSIVENPFTRMAQIDYELLYDIAYKQQLLADDLIDLEIQHIDRIINKINSDPEPAKVKTAELNLWKNIRNITKGSRRTGCGFTALGDMLAAIGLKYDSNEAIATINKVMRTKIEAELACTMDLAESIGTFEGWDKDKEFKLVDGQLTGTNEFFEMLCKEFPNYAKRMYKVGRRNVSWSTVAPTGTVSLMTQTTSGLEPLFSYGYWRRKKINPGEKGVRVDFVDQNGDSWQEYPILHPKLQNWYGLNSKESDLDLDVLSKEEMDELFKLSPWYGSTANDINWLKRVQIQQVIQKYTTHSISSTINLPNEVTEEEVSKIYLEAYERNLKGVTVYRDGSRSGVLITDNTKDDSKFEQHNAPKRPKSIPCKVHQSTSKGKDWLIVVGMLEDKPYEVFGLENTWNLPRGILDGTITKASRSRYELVIPDVITIDNIAKGMTDEEAAVTRLTSGMLRHGANIKFVVEQLNKTEGDMQSFNKVIARNIKKYIPEEEEVTGVTCDNCGSTNIVYQEGCQMCADCGTSKC